MFLGGVSYTNLGIVASPPSFVTHSVQGPGNMEPHCLVTFLGLPPTTYTYLNKRKHGWLLPHVFLNFCSDSQWFYVEATALVVWFRGSTHQFDWFKLLDFFLSRSKMMAVHMSHMFASLR